MTAQLALSDPVMAASPVVIGLDLSMTATGYAGPDGTRVFTSTGHKDATLVQRSARLIMLRSSIAAAVEAQQPDLVLIEAPSLGQGRQGGTHDRSGLWWLVVSFLLSLGVEVIEVPPATLKKYVTGKGNAQKPDIRMELFKRFDIDLRDDNEADAFALRALGLDVLGHPLVQMPALNRSALEKLPRPAPRAAA